MYSSQKLTPTSLIEHIVSKSKQLEENHIWIVPPDMERIAPYLERLKGMSPELHPLWGIPFAVKDNIDVAGMPTSAACPAYTYEPEQHSNIVAKLIEAGAIPIGKTNLDQFATGLVGTRSPFGETQNALKPELISGGSSSGSAVSVALGLAVFSLGTDTAGSGRVPAALNDLIGYKPAIGSWSNEGVVPACSTLDCVTVFAHTLEDAYLIDRIVRHVTKPTPLPTYNQAYMKQETATLLPKKLLLPQGELFFYGNFKLQYEAAWQHAISRLQQCGIDIEYVDYSIFNQAASLLYEGPWIAERWSDLGEFVEKHTGEIFPVTEQVLRSSVDKGYDAASVFTAIHQLNAYKKQTDLLLEDAVLVLPTCGGTWTRAQVATDPISTNSAMGHYTNHCNLLDLCAVAVPSDYAAPQLPFGITLFARKGQESILKGAAEQFMKTASIEIAVCGLHMRGFPLEKQLLQYGAHFIRNDLTAPYYRMVRLNTTPSKPGLIRDDNGASIEVEVWNIPFERLGAFISLIPSPLAIGKLTLQNGHEITGFICEAYAAKDGEDITHYGGWAKAVSSQIEA